MALELEAVLAANAEYVRAALHGAPRTAEPARRLVILTCMDARLELFHALGLEVGDMHVLRNAGGRASEDAIRSLVVSTRLLGTREVGVIHHTKCGLEGTTDAEVAARTGIDGISYLAFADLEESIRDDVERLRSCPHLPPELVTWGAVYDVDDGSLRLVEDPR